ncbi:MAG: hypothetical protein WA667_18755 [Candidatus Nitrosopolaris sp.]
MSRVFVLINDFSIANRWIPEILEANAFLINHFVDLRLHEELMTVEAFGGPSAVMRDQYTKGDVYGGLRDDSSRAFKMSAIDSHLQQASPKCSTTSKSTTSKMSPPLQDILQ